VKTGIHSDSLGAYLRQLQGVMKIILLITAINTCVFGQTIALFQPSSPAVGPFPADALTTVNTGQKTGRQINFPTPDGCAASPDLTVCQNTILLNQLDGFSIDARTNVCFSAAIDPGTLRPGIWYVALDSVQFPVSINQVLYDPANRCAYFKPDRVLDQQSRYLLVVSNGVRDANGHAIQADPSFKACIAGAKTDYCAGLDQALQTPEALLGGAWRSRVVAASVFTTMSATTWLEQARRFVDLHQPPVVVPAGNASSFSMADLKSFAYLPEDRKSPQTQVDIPLNVLSSVDRVMFGFYLSPNFLSVSGPSAGSIPTTPTSEPIASPTPVPGVPQGIPAGYQPVSFHVFLPSESKLPGNGHGFPVVIYGHGLGDNQFGAPTYMASTLAERGFATLALEITGHGFGPGGTVQLTSKDGRVSTVSSPGRGIAFSANGPIGPTDGCILPGPLAVRDCARQTAVDLFALVQTIRETNGMGVNLDPDRIYYVGQSFGSIYGTLTHVVEPGIRAAVLNGDGGPFSDDARLAISGRPLGTAYLGTNNPVLLNVPPAQPQMYFHDQFNDNYVYRDAPAVINDVPGALDIQQAFEAAEWLNVVGDPLSFAPHLKFQPLADMGPKRTMFQMGYGDLEVPNPMNSRVIQAANAVFSSWYFRFDRAVASHPELLGVTYAGVGFPILPHRILSNPTIFDPALPAETAIALAEQKQVASYFGADGKSNPDPNQFLEGGPYSGVQLFDVPWQLPTHLNFLQIAP
jgi:Bacterial Ig-like domain